MTASDSDDEEHIQWDNVSDSKEYANEWFGSTYLLLLLPLA